MMRTATKLLVVHVTATPPHLDIGAKEVRAMHKARGWSDIGYHYVIRRDGTVEPGRPKNHVGAHVAGFNSISLGVSMVGGVNKAGQPENNMTAAQFASLETLLRKLVKDYPGAKICGHRDLSPDRDGNGVIEPHEHIKACPCFDAIPWAMSKGLPAANIRGRWPEAGTAIRGDGPDARTAWLQRLLASLDYSFGPVDGIVGQRTKAAIEAFQTQNGLRVTGAFDQATVYRLRELTDRKPKMPAPIDDIDMDGLGAELEAELAKPIAEKPRGIIELLFDLIAAIFKGVRK